MPEDFMGVGLAVRVLLKIVGARCDSPCAC